MVKAHSTAGIEEATGRSWDDWVGLLDAAGAEQLDHTEIAEIARRNMPESVTQAGWWAQGAAVTYEQQKGLRVPGQSSAGDFQASVSKTFPGDKDAALARWRELAEGRREFGEVPLEGEPSTSSSQKWRYWRVRLADGTRVSVTFSDKAGGKSVVGVGHTKLASAEDISGWKAVWKDLLGQL